VCFPYQKYGLAKEFVDGVNIRRAAVSEATDKNLENIKKHDNKLFKNITLPTEPLNKKRN
jgi:hypothetical protein